MSRRESSMEWAFRLGMVFGALVIGFALVIMDRGERNGEEETHDEK